MSLLSASEMAAIQDLAESGMVTTVAIYHGTKTQTDNGQKWGFPATPDVTVLGWLTEISGVGVKLGTVDGAIQATTTHRLSVPIGTDIRVADKVVIDGRELYVQSTNRSDSYPAWLRCWLREQD